MRVIRTSSMGLFTPKDQLRDMQQHYAAQSLLGGTDALIKVHAPPKRGRQSLLGSLSPSSMTTCWR